MSGHGTSAYAYSKSTIQVKIYSLLSRANRYKWLLALGTIIFVSDQLSKEWILRNLSLGAYFPPENIEVIPGFFHIVHLGNTGAAWGMFEGMSFWLGLVAIAALGAILIFRRQLHLELLPVQISFGLLSGGIVGNLIDRMRHGYVVDFLDFHFGSFVWPAFNIADAGICLGVGIYLLYSFLHPTAIGEGKDPK